MSHVYLYQCCMSQGLPDRCLQSFVLLHSAWQFRILISTWKSTRQFQVLLQSEIWIFAPPFTNTTPCFPVVITPSHLLLILLQNKQSTACLEHNNHNKTVHRPLSLSYFQYFGDLSSEISGHFAARKRFSSLLISPSRFAPLHSRTVIITTTLLPK